jgi:hypothetical protein
MKTPSWMPRALFESALIVFSVLLALALDEWRDTRALRSRAETAVAAIAAELQANRSAVEKAKANHEFMTKTLRELETRGEKPTLELASKGVFNPAGVLDTAWTSAQQMEVIETIPYDLVLTLSRTYRRQDGYNTLGMQIAADMYMDLRRQGLETAVREGSPGISVLTMDFANREAALLRMYDDALAALEQHQKAGTLDE